RADHVQGPERAGRMTAMPTATETVSTVVRKARVTDAAAIQRLIKTFADRDEMLQRSLGELYENIRDFFVAEVEGRVVGCGAVHVCWSHLAEIKSLAVDEGCQGHGHGRRIVLACIDEAASLDLRQV